MRSSPRMRFPSLPVLCHENWGLRFTGPASDRRHKPSRLQRFEFVLPAMLASGFGSDRRNRCAKCAGGPRPIIARKSSEMCGTPCSQQGCQVCRLITAARTLGTRGTLGTGRFHGCEITGDVFPGRELVPRLGAHTINSRFQFEEEKAGLPILTSEELVELNYAFQLTPSLFFRLDNARRFTWPAAGVAVR